MQENTQKILVIDNYDSFTYNLVHLLHECGQQATVWRNDQFALEDVEDFDAILLSPGPGIPAEAGLLLDVIRHYADRKKILGVCLGLQAIAEVYGGKLYKLPKPVHGTATALQVKNLKDPLFHELPASFLVGRYHSWAVSTDDFPSELHITAVDEGGTIMALSHASLPIHGVQFHPESILTENGKSLMMNWLNA